jgi:hypothetical protein
LLQCDVGPWVPARPPHRLCDGIARRSKIDAAQHDQGKRRGSEEVFRSGTIDRQRGYGVSLSLPVVGASQDGLARKSDLHVATHEDNASRASATHFVFAALRLSIKKDF